MILFMAKIVFNNFRELFEKFQIYIIIYFIASGVISFLFCYYYGPIKNGRAINIISWLLKLTALFLIYCGTSFCEILFSIVGAFILIESFSEVSRVLAIICENNDGIIKRFKCKYFPEKRSLISLEEYQKQADIYTEKALEDLRQFCTSPDCNSWDLVNKLKNPDR
jgi:hypothetical protein